MANSDSTKVYESTQRNESYADDAKARRVLTVNPTGTPITPATEATLKSIKDSDGIKKITDTVTVTGAVTATVSGQGEAVTEGNKTKQLVQDFNSEQLLLMIVEELKIMNLHLMKMTDETFKVQDVEV